MKKEREKILNEEEMRIWLMWKHTFKGIFGRIVKEMQGRTGISDGDYMVLGLLTRSEDGHLRQQEMADTMGWTKSRLSHHLTRMEKRGLVGRRPLDKGVQVSITPEGTSAWDAAQPAVSELIRKYFLALLTEQDKRSIARIAAKANQDCT